MEVAADQSQTPEEKESQMALRKEASESSVERAGIGAMPDSAGEGATEGF